MSCELEKLRNHEKLHNPKYTFVGVMFPITPGPFLQAVNFICIITLIQQSTV